MAQEQRFELVSTLGRGGMAEVFLGWMHSVGGLRRKVAIKRILPELIQKQGKLFQQMFVDEARLAFQLEHDNIVRVYDVCQTSNTFFIVMEYVEGFDLKTIMERLRETNTVFPLGIAIYITLQVCAGLGYAHTLTDPDGKPLGLIHNDISPPNILIGRHGDVKVADFGLSDARSNDVTTPDGMIKGKFAYISPESTKAPPHITSRSDIFYIGICLWEMLAGRRLFQRNTDIETFKAVSTCTIPDIKRIRADLPDELLAVVYKSLAPDPDKRYQTCEEFYLELAAVATNLGIPVNRYDLSWLVNDLAGNKWSEFVGVKVSADVQKSLEDELGGMLPPGDAEMLAELGAGISEAVEVEANEAAKAQNANWLDDVFNDVGFEEGAVVFDNKKENKAEETAKPTETDKPKEDAKPAENAQTKENSGGKHVESGKIPLDRTKVTLNSPAPNTPVREVSGMLPSAKSTSVMVSRTKLDADKPPIRWHVTASALVLGIVLGALVTLLIAI